MIEAASIVAHSPILLNANERQVNTYITETFRVLADFVREHRIEQVVSLSAHPAFARRGFSVYVEKEFQLRFSEFGDLVTDETIKPSWNLYHALREQGLAFEPLDATKLDYGHGIPLYLLQRSLEKHPLEVLCVNDDPQASQEQRQAFGQHLSALLESFPAPILVLCTGDLCLPHDPSQLNACQAFNGQYVAYLEQTLTGKGAQTAVPSDIVAPCLQGPFDILRSMLPQVAYRSLSQTQQPPVSLYSALITKATR